MYEPGRIEAKWQAFWAEHRTNEPDLDSAERPFYNLMMYPYPSAEGLHVGNMYAFTGADFHGRYRRLRGADVFQPIGFDAFGIHSENYALKQGVHPMDLIPRNIANFTRQLRGTGIMYDWSRTVDTTDPAYYRWTQWIFLKLYDAGLAEKREAPVNWCPSCKTVLANEQVIAGRCERCDTPVERRMLSQWFFKITEYAPRLLDNLEWIDWSETTLTAQRNWIGRSEGATLRFPIARRRVAPDRHEPARLQRERPMIEVFTTRADTVFGATFMVLAPEHPLVEALVTDQRREAVETYRAATAAIDLVERKKAEKRKTGVFTGGFATNPATGEEVPVWIADYVLMEYGTGAIMAVPAHDQRDFEFARAHGLEVRPVVAPSSAVEGLTELQDVSPEALATADAAGGAVEGVAAAEGVAAGEAFVEHTAGEVLVNSGRFSGMRADEGGRAIVDWLAERRLAENTLNYRIHDWCISRQRYWGPPIPILYCERCGTVPVPESDLPVVLPRVENIKPDAGGIAPLARDEDFHRAPCPECGGEARRETDVSDTFLDSAWYFLRYPSTEFEDRPFDVERTGKWLPVDTYIGGEEHAVLHLLYSRFITMVLHDLGHLGFEEPYLKFRKHGLLIRAGAKMSKSRGNVVVPDDYIEGYGADVFRCYLMFLGPYEEGGDFRDEGIAGPHRFLQRVWDVVMMALDSPGGGRGAVSTGGDGAVPAAAGGPPDTRASARADGSRDPAGAAEIERKLHRTIKQVTGDFERLSFNTAIAALMEYLNAIRAEGRIPTPDEVRPLVIMLAPMAPHLAEELWERLGGEPSIFDRAEWPPWDEEKLRADTVEIPVQVNGRVRSTITVERGASRADVETRALEDDNVRRHLGGAEVRKVIHVPDRLLNLVVG